MVPRKLWSFKAHSLMAILVDLRRGSVAVSLCLDGARRDRMTAMRGYGTAPPGDQTWSNEEGIRKPPCRRFVDPFSICPSGKPSRIELDSAAGCRAGHLSAAPIETVARVPCVI